MRQEYHESRVKAQNIPGLLEEADHVQEHSVLAQYSVLNQTRVASGSVSAEIHRPFPATVRAPRLDCSATPSTTYILFCAYPRLLLRLSVR